MSDDKEACARCGQAKHRGRCKGAGGKRSTVARRQPVAVVSEPAEPSRLRIEPGHGCEAWIENDALQLVQGEDIVALSRTEAKVLFAQFNDWVNA